MAQITDLVQKNCLINKGKISLVIFEKLIVISVFFLFVTRNIVIS